GADTLHGGGGFDTLRGGAGDDSLTGGTEADVLDGAGGADRLEGGDGADLLLGGAGADLLVGGEGDDTLEGAGRGDTPALAQPDGGDTLFGGAGADLFVLAGAGDAAWSGLAATSVVVDFSRTEGDRLRIGEAGASANAGTLTLADGFARPLVWSGSAGLAQVALTPGMRLPAQPLPGLDAVQVSWIAAVTGANAPAGGWLVLDMDADGRLGAADAVWRFGAEDAPVTIGAADFLPGTFLAFGAAAAPVGTAGSDRLRGGSRGELFLGTTGRDTIDGGGGAPNAISYAGLAGPIDFGVLGGAAGFGLVNKPGGEIDLLRAIHGVTGTSAADTLDGAAAPAEAVYVLSLEGGGGADRITGNFTRAVQASYAGSPGAARIDLAAGTAEDGWGSTDTLAGIRRVAATSAFDDTVIGSAADEVFLSGAGGSKRFEGGGGTDEYRYAGAGAVSIVLTEEIIGLFRVPAHAEKPGGARDTLVGISVAAGGAGDDVLRGGMDAERLSGGPGDDTLDGAGGLDTVFQDLLSPTAGLGQRGVVLDLTTGVAVDPWGGTDTLIAIENAWGTTLADDMTGRAVAGVMTYLRGLAGDDTLRAPPGGTLVAADHADDPAAVLADLGAGWALDGWGGRDVLVGIAALRGSAFADTVSGGTAAERIEGGEGDDSLAGGGGADRLDGGAGNDTLDGGAGADTMAGGLGDDLYRVDSAADVIEEPGAATGIDTVESSVSLYLPTTVEVLTLLAGAGGIFGVGNTLANRIQGNEAGNLIIAGAGADTVDGGGGDDSVFGQADADLLRGGEGRDWIFGGDADDTIEGGAGNDVLFGETGADLLRGEAGADYLVGGIGADTLEGGTENDLLYGQDGGDLLLGGAGIDYIAGGAGNDTIDGGDQPDAIYGEGGDDLIYGGIGFFADIMVGGEGNDTLDGSGPPGSGPRNRGDPDRLHGWTGDDTYFVDTPHDLIFEAPGAGHDVVHAEITGTGYYLWSNVEDLVLHGATPFGVGNALANRITGTPLTNWLLGGAGDDTLDGGGGSDVLFGQAGADLLVIRRGPGRVTVGDFQPGADQLRLEGFGFNDMAGAMARTRQVGAHLVLDLAPDAMVILQNVRASQLSARDFDFA
ncbi:MAG: hypothetical protein K2X74_21760, partial [Acetobacteraceae bacterium]|nr:hypothetical protein [Acetobacteraceae bacterium]